MKKVKFESKLTLNKETISKLNDQQMKNIAGGFIAPEGTNSGSCATGPTKCATYAIGCGA